MFTNQETNNSTTHKGKLINPTNRNAMQSGLNSLMSSDMTEVLIPPGYAHRADLISNEVFKTVTNDWLLLMMNNIKDPFQELNAGDTIIIPNT